MHLQQRQEPTIEQELTHSNTSSRRVSRSWRISLQSPHQYQVTTDTAKEALAWVLGCHRISLLLGGRWEKKGGVTGWTGYQDKPLALSWLAIHRALLQGSLCRFNIANERFTIWTYSNHDEHRYRFKSDHGWNTIEHLNKFHSRNESKTKWWHSQCHSDTSG